MGADIYLDESCAIVNGVRVLQGGRVEARDLRGAAALVKPLLGAANHRPRSGEHLCNCGQLLGTDAFKASKRGGRTAFVRGGRAGGKRTQRSEKCYGGKIRLNSFTI